MKTVIYPHRAILAQNKVMGENMPPLVVQCGDDVRMAHRVLINGPSEMIYRPTESKEDHRAWLETEAEVTLGMDDNFPEAVLG